MPRVGCGFSFTQPWNGLIRRSGSVALFAARFKTGNLNLRKYVRKVRQAVLMALSRRSSSKKHLIIKGECGRLARTD